MRLREKKMELTAPKAVNKWLAKIPKKRKEQKSKPDISSRFSSSGIHQIVSDTNIDVKKPSRMWLLKRLRKKLSGGYQLGFGQGLRTSLSDMEERIYYMCCILCNCGSWCRRQADASYQVGRSKVTTGLQDQYWEENYDLKQKRVKADYNPQGLTNWNPRGHTLTCLCLSLPLTSSTQVICRSNWQILTWGFMGV